MKAKFLNCMIVILSALLVSSPVFALNSATPPNFSLMDVRTGKMVCLYEFSNKVILLNFFTTWCPWDEKEFDYVLVPLYEEYYKNDVNVLFISIHLDPDKGQEINSYIKEHNINWLVLEGGKWSESKVAADYGVDAVPRTFILKFSENVKEVAYQKRGHNQNNFYEFYDAIETAKREILGEVKNESINTQKQSPIVSHIGYAVQFADGQSIELNCSTSSSIMRSLFLDASNHRLHLKVRESNEEGFLIIFLPKEFLEKCNSDLNEVVVVVDGKDSNSLQIEDKNGGYLISICYGQGEHEINVFYKSRTLTVRVQSLFGLPISNALVVLEWPNGETYRELMITSSGKAKFENVPILSENYTVYVKYGILSFQFIPTEIPIDRINEITYTAYLHYDTLLLFGGLFTTFAITLKHSAKWKKVNQDGSITK